LCPICREAVKQSRRDAKKLAKKTGTYRPCPDELRERILRFAQRAFAAYSGCEGYAPDRQFHEGMPAVSTPFLWLEASVDQDPREVLANAAERLHRFDAASAKVPVAVDARPETIRALGEPLICVRQSDWWTVMKEWSE
jgi:hypothetical protein